MNTRSFGKKCKCGHFESDHVNLNRNFYEPNAIPKMGAYMSPPPTMDTLLKQSNVRGVCVTSLVRKIKAEHFGMSKRTKLHSFTFHGFHDV
ncbi:hypothetical protein K0U27_02715 [archaeon]|nr:hypothetical protein [archaeon]